MITSHTACISKKKIWTWNKYFNIFNIFNILGPGGRRHQQYAQTPMGGSISGATPYTPGATPSNLISEDEANSLMQQYHQYGSGDTSNRATPAYSTPGFTPSGQTPSSNFGDSSAFTGGSHGWGGTPRTPKQQQTPQQHQGRQQYKQRQPGGGGGGSSKGRYGRR